MDIDDWLKNHNVKNYTINEDLSVDVNGIVNLASMGLVEIPIRFGVVSGSFYCNGNKLLINLEGCPVEVGQDFNCMGNKLFTLKGCPIKIGGNFLCNNNKLTNLLGGPKEVGGGFFCYANELTSLDGCPAEIKGGFNFRYNKLGESELFLYDYNPVQIRCYYDSKNLNEMLVLELSEEVGIGNRQRKI